jgi:competence protein ComEA
VIVSMLVMIVLSGGALYTARPSEGAPKVVYTASLQEIEDESQDSLKVDINTADIDELDELPEVGPSTAQSIVEYRQTNGQFSSVEELEEIPGIGPETLEKIAPFATV